MSPVCYAGYTQRRKKMTLMEAYFLALESSSRTTEMITQLLLLVTRKLIFKINEYVFYRVKIAFLSETICLKPSHSYNRYFRNAKMILMSRHHRSQGHSGLLSKTVWLEWHFYPLLGSTVIFPKGLQVPERSTISETKEMPHVPLLYCIIIQCYKSSI